MSLFSLKRSSPKSTVIPLLFFVMNRFPILRIYHFDKMSTRNCVLIRTFLVYVPFMVLRLLLYPLCAAYGHSKYWPACFHETRRPDPVHFMTQEERANLLDIRSDFLLPDPSSQKYPRCARRLWSICKFQALW